MAIIYKNILTQLKEAGYSTARLRKEHILGESTLQRIRKGEPISTETIDLICGLLHCQPNDIMEHVEDEEG